MCVCMGGVYVGVGVFVFVRVLYMCVFVFVCTFRMQVLGGRGELWISMCYHDQYIN